MKKITDKKLQTISKSANVYADKIDKLIKYKSTLTDGEKENISNNLDKLFQNIKSKRQKGVNSGGELNKDNIMFKMLRRNGYIDKIVNTKNDIYNDLMSINEGCCGYGLKDDDRVLDIQNEFVKYVIKYLLNKLNKYDSNDPQHEDDSFSWFVMLQEFLLLYKNEEPSRLDEYQRAVKKCCIYCKKILNNNFTDNYSEPDKMKKTLKNTLKKLENCISK